MSIIEFDETDLSRPELPRVRGPLDLRAAAMTIAAEHGTTWEEMRLPGRMTHLVAARRDLYMLLRARGWSYPRIARAVNRDHTTVMAAVRKAAL